MRPAWYLACGLLLGVAMHTPPSWLKANGNASARVFDAPPEPPDRRAAKELEARAQDPPTQPSAGGQNSTGRNPPDYLQAQIAAVQNKEVPLSAEPHHQVVLRNDFVNVYSVSVQPLDATLVHKHDLPYLAVSLGATAVENAVVGKPEVRLNLQDGQVTFSPGGFAHAVRTDAGMVFRNVTMELTKPQGTVRNACKQIVPGPLGCPEQAGSVKPRAAKASSEGADDVIPYLETDEIRVDLIQVSSGHDYVEATPKENGLLVALTNANLDVNLGGAHSAFQHEGDIVWFPAGTHRRVVDFLGTRSSFLLVSFKDSAGVGR